MEEITFGPPPLPPKTRKSPPESGTATVLSGSEDVFAYDSPEIHKGHSQISNGGGNHVVKIRINPGEDVTGYIDASVVCDVSPCIRISVNNNEIIQNAMPEATPDRTSGYYFYAPYISSGQISPSDTLDSGTCSDLDNSTPPPLPKKKISTSGVSVTVINTQHKRASSLTDSDECESNISCDSLNSEDLATFTNKECKASAFLPQGLLQDIRDRSAKLTQQPEILIPETKETTYETEETAIKTPPQYEENNLKTKESNHKIISKTQENKIEIKTKEQSSLTFDTDKFYKFHLNEHAVDKDNVKVPDEKGEDETFAGYKDLLGGNNSATIRSAKGTVRGVKNRVRAGIATFLLYNDHTKTYKEKDAGKVVVYTTTMGIVRETHHACMKVKQILRTLLVKFEERDVFMSTDYQAEIRDRMRCDYILVPQVFVDGQHIGDAETVERLNESGELRRILKPYKSMDACTTCKACGGYRLLPCPVCNGSKKSVHRNHFTTEFVALKCMNCDEVGLVKCSTCSL